MAQTSLAARIRLRSFAGKTWGDERAAAIYNISKGLVNTALDATPIAGVTKNTIEMFTGDWLPDRALPRDSRPSEESTDQHHRPIALDLK